MTKNAKLIRVNFAPVDETAAFIIAFVKNEESDWKQIVKEAYSNWSTDNHLNWEESELKKAIANSSYAKVGNVELQEEYTDWDDFYIFNYQKLKNYKING